MDHGILETIASVAMGILGLGKSFTFVKEGQLGSKTVFGKAVRKTDGNIKVIKPGFILLIPLVNTIQRAHIRMDSVELNDLNVTLKDGLSYHYSAFVAYHVSDEPKDLEKFLYLVENPHELISQKLSSSIRELLILEEDTSKTTGKEMNEKLEKEIKTYLKDKLGVILDSCGITSLTESVQAQQVKVTMAKYTYAKTLYTGNTEVPETVMAACFGATPTIAPSTVVQVKHQKKKETFWEKLTKEKNNDGEEQ